MGPDPGQRATSGNFAHGVGGTTVVPLGACTEFSVYHLMDLFDGEEGLRSSDSTGFETAVSSARESNGVNGSNGHAAEHFDGRPLFYQWTTVIEHESTNSNGSATRGMPEPMSTSKAAVNVAKKVKPPAVLRSDSSRPLTGNATLGDIADRFTVEERRSFRPNIRCHVQSRRRISSGQRSWFPER